MYVENSKRIHAASPGQNSSIISRVFCMIHAHNRLTELVAIQDNIEKRKLKKSRINEKTFNRFVQCGYATSFWLVWNRV